jgi:hypothetical protein
MQGAAIFVVLSCTYPISNSVEGRSTLMALPVEGRPQRAVGGLGFGDNNKSRSNPQNGAGCREHSTVQYDNALLLVLVHQDLYLTASTCDMKFTRINLFNFIRKTLVLNTFVSSTSNE